MTQYEDARESVRRADARFGHRWWAPIGFVIVLLAASVKARYRR